MHLFLAGPMTQVLAGPASSRDQFRATWERITAALRSQGHEVFSAHEREEWGADLYSPSSALTGDLAAMKAADVLLAYVGDPPSPGVQMELGVALALDKQIVIFTDGGPTEPYLLRGIPEVAVSASVVEVHGLGELERRIVEVGQSLVVNAGQSVVTGALSRSSRS